MDNGICTCSDCGSDFKRIEVVVRSDFWQKYVLFLKKIGAENLNCGVPEQCLADFIIGFFDQKIEGKSGCDNVFVLF